MKTGKNNRRSVYEYEQPFDLFEEFERGKGRTSIKESKKTPAKNHFKVLILALSFIGTVVTGFGFLGVMNKPATKKPFVLVELRAINSSGNPIPGATVFFQKKKFGVTDSFGEWRRYLRLRPGRSLDIRITKKGRTTLQARKTVVVPKVSSEDQEPELKVSLELTPPSKPANARIRQKKAPVEKIVSERPSREADSINEEVKSLRVLGSSSQARKVLLKDSAHLGSVDIRLIPFKSKYGTLMEAHQSRVLGVKVVPELIAQAAEKGLQIKKNAEWRYDVEYIPHRGQVGFIKGTLYWKRDGGVTKRTFIRNFSKTIVETADTLLKLAKVHINRSYMVYRQGKHWLLGTEGAAPFWRLHHGLKLVNSRGNVFKLKKLVGGELKLAGGVPCQIGYDQCSLFSPSTKEAPSNPTWDLMKIQVNGSLPQAAEVYVNGYRAFPAENLFEFWGKSDKAHILTVLNQGEIFFRSKIIPSKLHALPINLPQRVARR